MVISIGPTVADVPAGLTTDPTTADDEGKPYDAHADTKDGQEAACLLFREMMPGVCVLVEVGRGVSIGWKTPRPAKGRGVGCVPLYGGRPAASALRQAQALRRRRIARPPRAMNETVAGSGMGTGVCVSVKPNVPPDGTRTSNTNRTV